MIDSRGIAKLTDFGMTRFKTNQHMTSRIGTSIYMAPEIVNNEFYDEKCDVFSFGIIMFEVFTRNFKPYGANTAQIEIKVAQNPLFRFVFFFQISNNKKRPALPVDMGPLDHSQIAFIELMTKCWSHNASARPSFSEIIAALNSIQG